MPRKELKRSNNNTTDDQPGFSVQDLPRKGFCRNHHELWSCVQVSKIAETVAFDTTKVCRLSWAPERSTWLLKHQDIACECQVAREVRSSWRDESDLVLHQTAVEPAA